MIGAKVLPSKEHLRTTSEWSNATCSFPVTCFIVSTRSAALHSGSFSAGITREAVDINRFLRIRSRQIFSKVLLTRNASSASFPIQSTPWAFINIALDSGCFLIHSPTFLPKGAVAEMAYFATGTRYPRILFSSSVLPLKLRPTQPATVP